MCVLLPTGAATILYDIVLCSTCHVCIAIMVMCGYWRASARVVVHTCACAKRAVGRAARRHHRYGHSVPCSLVVRISGFHPEDPGSIPGMGKANFFGLASRFHIDTFWEGCERLVALVNGKMDRFDVQIKYGEDTVRFVDSMTFFSVGISDDMLLKCSIVQTPMDLYGPLWTYG